jgi:peptidoglycan/LPS O-acetylase OafA/YrhL
MRIAHVPGLDGLRGLAVTGVLLFHAGKRLRGGYLGVDLFFVLSGFLITSILVEELEQTRAIDLRAFWVRRARRLLPALLSLMPAIALYAHFFARGSELATLRADALATLGYVANWRAVLVHRSYWQMFEEPSPLEHTWSLAIEEQFYVVWPLIALAALRLGGRRALFAVAAVLAVASAASMIMLYDDGGGTTRVYLGTDTRGAAILLGAALACIKLPAVPRRALDALGIAAAGILGACWWALDGQDAFLYRGGFWLTEVCGLVLVVCAVHAPSGMVASALSWRPLRWMGLVSYGVYLWHWPVFVVLTEARTHASGVVLLAFRLVVTLGIAGASYRFLEQPIRRRGITWGRPVIVVPATVAAAVGVVLLSTRGAEAKDASATFKPTPLVLPPSPTRRDRQATMDVLPPASALPPGTTRILVLGDSVALSLGAMMYWMQLWDESSVAERAIGDCSILFGRVPVRSMSGADHGNGDCARSWEADVEETRPDIALVVLGGAYFSRVKVNRKWVGVCDRGWRDAYVDQLTGRLRAMAPHAARRVVVLAAYPGEAWQTPTIDDDVDCYNQVLAASAEQAGAEVLDLGAWLCPAHRCVTTSHGQPVRPDGLHFDGPGAEETAHWVMRTLHGGAVPEGDAGSMSMRSFLTPSASPITTRVIPASSTNSGSGL